MLHVAHVKLRNQYSTRRKFSPKFHFNLSKKLEECYIWSRVFCGAENWTLRKVDQKYLNSVEVSWRRSEISWAHHVRCEEVLHEVENKRNILLTLKRKKAKWIVAPYTKIYF